MEEFFLAELIQVVDNRGRTLTPCRRKVAEREVRLNRAKWTGKNSIRLRFDPFAYRYIRLKVLARDDHTCYWCGSPGYTMDHVIPWSKGGRTTMNNCICACEECNGARGDMPAEEFALLKNVAAPTPEGGPPVRPPIPLGVPRLAVGAEAQATAPTQAPAPAVALPLSPAPDARPALLAKLSLRPVPRSQHHTLRDLLDPLRPEPSLRLFY